MANGPEHLRLGAVAGMWGAGVTCWLADRWGVPIVSGWLQGAGVVLVGGVVGALFGVLPDIDLRGTLSRAMGVFGWLLTGVVREVSLRATGRKHRGLTHRWWFPVLVAVPLFVAHPAVGVAAVLGGVSHRWADGLMFGRN